MPDTPTTYASVSDVEDRLLRDLTPDEQALCETLLQDAATIIDAQAPGASANAKLLVSCRMVLRNLGSGEDSTPIGATQGTVSALGYSQTWTVSGGGSAGELYLNKMDRRLLGLGNRIGSYSPVQELAPQPEVSAP